ncbi:MAG: hypothetical protein JW725_05370 [Candidatus Babeliaceae bacterium]|nr:hypothetical protein [Candidatus Babeliaceae bacterium]
MKHPNGHLDVMHIPIRKIGEDNSTVTYQFESNFWIQDPEIPSRNAVYAVYSGEILVHKDTQECVVIHEMPFDTGGVSSRALRAIKKRIEHGEYPDKTAWSSG